MATEKPLSLTFYSPGTHEYCTAVNYLTMNATIYKKKQVIKHHTANEHNYKWTVSQYVLNKSRKVMIFKWDQKLKTSVNIARQQQ